MLNKVQILGRLGRDPESRSLTNGDKVVNLRIATTERWKSKDGEQQERTEWHSVVIWNEKAGEIVMRYVKKGDLLYVEGQLQTRKWEKDGTDHYATEVVVQRFGGDIKLMPKGTGSKSDDDPGQVQTSKSTKPKEQPKPNAFADLDDDIPF